MARPDILSLAQARLQANAAKYSHPSIVIDGKRWPVFDFRAHGDALPEWGYVDDTGPHMLRPGQQDQIEEVNAAYFRDGPMDMLEEQSDTLNILGLHERALVENGDMTEEIAHAMKAIGITVAYLERCIRAYDGLLPARYRRDRIVAERIQVEETVDILG